MAAAAACIVASPTSTVPGVAADWRRDAVLTMSPATIPCPWAPMVTAASPVTRPARALTPGANAGMAASSSSAARTDQLGVVLAGDRRAPHGHHGITDELLDDAAIALDHVPRQVEVAE
ncbi:MAG: hypothetical protein R3C32_11350 [Chloroflexota bacterium]